MKPAVLLISVMSGLACGQTYTISTFAGAGSGPPDNVPGASVSLNQPESVAVDRQGNLFFADQNTVFRWDAATGVVTIVAGDGTGGSGGDNGPAVSAQLSMPTGIAVDPEGNLYIADSGHYRIRKISNGVISTVAGNGEPGFGGDNGPATRAQLFDPLGVAVDNSGNLYIADAGNMRIRKVSNGVITTVVGSEAQLRSPQGVAVDSAGNLYIADSAANRISKISTTGAITTVAASAPLSGPHGVALDSTGNLYIAEFGGNRIRKVSNGVMTTVAGNGRNGFSGDNGPATNAEFIPAGVAVDAAGNLYIADIYNRRIRKVSNGVIRTVAGNGEPASRGDNGPAASSHLDGPTGVAVDAAGSLYIIDSRNIRKISNGVITTVAANAELYGPAGIAVTSTGDLYIADSQVHVSAMGSSNSDNRVRKISKGVMTTAAGSGEPGFSGDKGPATSAQLYDPEGVAVDSAGDLYIADSHNNRIRKVSNGVITTVAGNGAPGFTGDGGPATSARLSGPRGIAVDAAGNLYIADTDNSRIRKVSKGVITTVAGNGTDGFSGDNGPATRAQLFRPNGVAVDSAGDLYIAVGFSNRIRKVSNGVIATIAGNGNRGFSGDNGPAASAQLNRPNGVAVDSAGNICVADTGNLRIRILRPEH